MAVEKQMWNRLHIVGMTAAVMASLIWLSACGAADSPDGKSSFVLPTDPPSGGGPISTAESVLEDMVALMGSQQDLAVEAYITYEVLQDSGQLLSFNTVQYLDMRRPNRLAWTTVRDDATVTGTPAPAIDTVMEGGTTTSGATTGPGIAPRGGGVAGSAARSSGRGRLARPQSTYRERPTTTTTVCTTCRPSRRVRPSM